MPQPSGRFHDWLLISIFVSLSFLGIGFVYWAKTAVYEAIEQARNQPSLFVNGGGGPNFSYHEVIVSGKGQAKASEMLRHHLDYLVSMETRHGREAPLEPHIIQGLTIRFRSADLKLDRNAVEPIKRYKQLDSLSVESVEVDEDALQLICGIDNLHCLYLESCQLPSGAWKRFSQCEHLTELSLENSSITDEEIDTIRQALPHCKVDW